MIESIELLNCRKLDCYPKTLPKKNITRWEQSREERIKAERFFYSNINSWIVNADEIMRDSRYFLASVNFKTSICPTQMTCLGTFIEWWKFRQNYSWTSDGLPIWHISGNPMTGSSGCSAVDVDGNIQQALLQVGLIDVVSSFNRIARRYAEAQKECDSYSIETVLSRLSVKL